MEKKMDRKKTVFNYILNGQIIFFLLAFIIICKYMDVSYYDFSVKKYMLFIAFIVFFLIVLGVYIISKSKNINENILNINLIIFDILLINIIISITNLYEVRFLYLIPIIISAVKYGLFASVFLATATGLLNIIFYISSSTDFHFQYSLETDLILWGIFILISWLIGNGMEIQTRISKSLYKTQENLNKNKQLLETLVNEMPLSLIAVDKDEKIVLINESSLKIWNVKHLNPSFYVGRKYRNYFETVIKNVSYEDSLIKDLLCGNKSYYKEKRVYNNRLFEIIGQPVYDQDNLSIKYAMILLNDITKEEQLKEKLNHFDKLNMVGQMAASIAHEIKNPLTTIKGFLELSLKTKTNLDEQQLILLNDEVERCTTIASDFLSMTRKSKEQKELVNLRNLVEQIAILIDKDASFNGINLKLELENTSKISLYKNQIKQLLLNLSRNAIEAMPQGGILTIRLLETEKNIYLEVEDQGEGIPPHVLEKLGTPFITTKKNGTGLGMTICQRIVDNHEAKMKIYTKTGIGTKISISFNK